MQNIFKIIVIFFTLFALLFGQSNSDLNNPLGQEENKDTNIVITKNVKEIRASTSVLKNNAFKVGEYLKFNIKYGFIHAGSATMQVVKRYNYLNNDCFLIKTTARSARGFEWIFKVRDTVTTTFDANKFHSLKFVKKLREGSYYYDLITEYDQINGKAYVERTRYYDREATRIKKQKFLELNIPFGTLDILSSFYKIRLHELEVNKPIFLTNHDNKKIYELQVDVLKKEIIEVPAGKFKCIKIEPRLKGEAIFKQKGRLWVWLTDDQYKIPVKMDSKVIVGSISTELKSIKNGPANIPAKIK